MLTQSRTMKIMFEGRERWPLSFKLVMGEDDIQINFKLIY